MHGPGEAPDRQGRDLLRERRLDAAGPPRRERPARRLRRTRFATGSRPCNRSLAGSPRPRLSPTTSSVARIIACLRRTRSRARIDRAISELVSNQVLVGDSRHYALAHRGWASALTVVWPGRSVKSATRRSPCIYEGRAEDAARRRASPARGRPARTRPRSRRRAPQGVRRMPRASQDGSEITASEVAATIESALSAAEALERPVREINDLRRMPACRSASAPTTPSTGVPQAGWIDAAQARLGPPLLARVVDEPRRAAAARARSGRAEVRGDAGARPRVSAGRSRQAGVVPLRGDFHRDRVAVLERRAPRDVARSARAVRAPVARRRPDAVEYNRDLSIPVPRSNRAGESAQPRASRPTGQDHARRAAVRRSPAQRDCFRHTVRSRRAWASPRPIHG